jgi:hypothetical protein
MRQPHSPIDTIDTVYLICTMFKTHWIEVLLVNKKSPCHQNTKIFNTATATIIKVQL